MGCFNSERMRDSRDPLPDFSSTVDIKWTHTKNEPLIYIIIRCLYLSSPLHKSLFRLVLCAFSMTELVIRSLCTYNLYSASDSDKEKITVSIHFSSSNIVNNIREIAIWENEKGKEKRIWFGCCANIAFNASSSNKFIVPFFVTKDAIFFRFEILDVKHRAIL